MKVLQVTTNYPNASNPIFGIFMKEQVESLERFGVENTIFFSDGSGTGQNQKHGAKWVHAQSAIKLLWKVLTNRYDLIHCHSAMSGLILFCSGTWLWKKCIISLQNDPEKEFDGKFFKLFYRICNKVIVKKNSKYDVLPKVVYLPNGCNENFFKPMDKNECKRKLGLDENKRYVLFVDSNTAKKRTQKRKDRFDEVLRILRNEYGYDNLEELIMIGVGRQDVPTYMNACDLHLLVSDLEGSPNSVKECVFCNVPVVCTNVGNVAEMLSGVDGCYVTDSFEATDIAKDVNKVLSSQDEFNGRISLNKKGYSLNAVAEKLYALYNDLK